MTPKRSILLTGATSGIGLAAATLLAGHARALILQGPEPEADIAETLRSVRHNARDTPIHYVSVDFRDLATVDAMAARVSELIDSIDVLINNAAIPGPPTRQPADSGADITFHVNYLAGVLLTNALLSRIPSDGRVVNVSSATHLLVELDLDDLSFEHRPYSPVTAYAQSKLAIVTYGSWLAKTIPQRVVSVHPGVISTRLLQAMFNVEGDPPAHGGANVVAAMAADVPTGSYLDERFVGRPESGRDRAGDAAATAGQSSALLGREVL